MLNKKIMLLLLVLEFPVLAALTSCANQSTSSSPAASAARPSATNKLLPPISNCPSSANSERVAALLDQQSFEAAEGLFDKYLTDSPDDARLHIEYVRHLLLTSNLANSGNISSPILKDGLYWAGHVATTAAKRASQLDSSCKDLLADVIHATLLGRINDALDRNSGIIGEPKGFFYPRPNAEAMETGFASSMIQLGWVALEMSPGRSKKMLDGYRQAMERAISKGKIATAAMLGNLLGDLEKGDTSGDLDFIYACEAFARSLEHFEPSSESDWIGNTIHIFQDIFQKDLQQASPTSGPSSLISLEQKLGKRGYSLFSGSGPSFGLQEQPTGAAPGQP